MQFAVQKLFNTLLVSLGVPEICPSLLPKVCEVRLYAVQIQIFVGKMHTGLQNTIQQMVTSKSKN